jgi:hypothetical protein
MEVRILVGARNSGDSFDLRCFVREHLVSWLLQAYPESLPRTRAELRVAPSPRPDGAFEPAHEQRMNEHEHGQSAA